MKLLLVITDYEFAYPFIQDLESQLASHGLQADVLDLNNFWHKQNGKRKQFASSFFRRFTRMRKIGTIVSLVLVKRYLRKIRGSYDAVNIHSCEHIYFYLVNDLKNVSSNISVMIWGSDFYRAPVRIREKNRKIFDSVRYIIFGNPQNAADFTAYYKAYSEKCLIAGFGSMKFKPIKDLLANGKKQELRSAFGLPGDKIIVSCGYNGREGQQHILLLEQLENLEQSYREKIFLLLQFGYGADPVYREKVRRKLEDMEIAYRILERMLSDEEVAALRVIPDIILNAQITDGFSSSIQEHLAAKNIVIVGDWLPYGWLQQRGMFLRRSPLDRFAAELTQALDQLESYQERASVNTGIIESISSWPVRIREWKQVYAEDVGNLYYSNFINGGHNH